MSRSILVKSSGVRGSGQNKNCHVSFFVVPSYRKFASRYESEDDESDDDSLGGDQDYETMSNHGGTKKIINKGRWNKEEVSEDDLNLLTWSNGIKLEKSFQRWNISSTFKRPLASPSVSVSEVKLLFCALPKKLHPEIAPCTLPIYSNNK